MIKIIIAFLFYLSAYSQNELKLNDNMLYLITRSTDLKVDFIAKDFNLKDTLSTHIGIGIVVKGKLNIYNVSNTKTNSKGSALICDNFSSFTSLEDIIYTSIWEKELTNEKMNNLKLIISKYKKEKISFDNGFLLNNKNNLYCSEFVANVLDQLEYSKVKPTKKKLNSFYSSVFHREELEYIPVDFFQMDKSYKLIYEHRF